MTAFAAPLRSPLALALAVLGLATLALPAHAEQGINSAATQVVPASFDMLHTRIRTEGNVAVFSMAVRGRAGTQLPDRVGKLAGASVYSYVWPTNLDPSLLGFEPGSGILAFAATVHPDFDDTPLVDENGDGDSRNDGALWHSHWVVLQKDAACGPDGLKVGDIPEGAKPALPQTWPGLALLIDSPGWTPQFRGANLEVRVPFADMGAISGASFDGVTAALRVNANLHSPLLCVVNVFKVASGNLSLPGRVDP